MNQNNKDYNILLDNDTVTFLYELLPCPFCGSAAQIIGNDFCASMCYYVTCTGPDCYCSVGEEYDRCAMPDHVFVSEDLAASAWNRRAPNTN